MDAEDNAERVLRVTKDFGDYYAEVTAFRVPESDRYSERIKYPMQYGNAAGETIVRYDNFPDHPDAERHHKHTSDGQVEDIEFEGLQSLFKQFKTEVKSYGHQW